ncbi:hypothetical protein G7Y79_00078g099960 [Physcia stellaris]|nr:hypothetical protein G7Y79_00078g099960 [Physcia stellaris]
MDDAQQPPPGGDQDRGYIIVVVSAVFIALASIAIALRVYVRIKLVPSMGLDDYTALIAWALCWVNLACHVVEVNHGLGRHEYYLSLSDVAISGKLEYISQIHNVLAVTFTKVSATLFLFRVLARGTTKRTQWPLYILMALFVTIAIVTIVADSVQCIPLSASWDRRVKGKCLRPHQVVAFAYALGGFTIITDVVCAAFPVYIIQKLQMNLRKKVALSFVMSMGLLTAACCAVKVSYLGGIKATDSTWGSLDVDVWASVEQNLGVTACSIPALYPLIKASLSSKRPGNGGEKKLPRSYLSPLLDGKIARLFGRSGHSTVGTKNDAGSVSEERILESHQSDIRKTTDIHLDIVSRETSRNKNQDTLQIV